jgi:hypothetical protein
VELKDQLVGLVGWFGHEVTVVVAFVVGSIAVIVGKAKKVQSPFVGSGSPFADDRLVP